MTTEAKRVYLQNENDEILLPYSAQALEDGDGNVISETYAKNTELNNKLDLNANNLDTAGKSLISGLSMPSNKYIDLTLGESGSSYTAPANGYFSVGGNFGNVNGYFTLALWDNAISHTLLASEAKANSSDYGCFCWIPVKKGDKVFAYYNYSPFSSTTSGTPFFMFIYAEGSK